MILWQKHGMSLLLQGRHPQRWRLRCRQRQPVPLAAGAANRRLPSKQRRFPSKQRRQVRVVQRTLAQS